MQNQAHKILIVDELAFALELARELSANEKFQCDVISSSGRAMTAMETNGYDIIISRPYQCDNDVFEILRHWHKHSLRAKFLVLQLPELVQSNHSSFPLEFAVKCHGAQYLQITATHAEQEVSSSVCAWLSTLQMAENELLELTAMPCEEAA